MELSFLGAAREVGRSSILVNGKRSTLLDCGVKFDEDSVEYPLLGQKTIAGLDAVALSHAHLDHCGFLPALYAAGYRKHVYLTKPTRDLMQLLLSDYLRLMHLKKSAFAYSSRDLLALLAKTKLVEYGAEVDGLVFHQAGHILGSALVQVNDEKTVLYTGDLSLRDSRLLDGSVRGLAADVLVIESTYGSPGDAHIAVKDAAKKLIDSINATFEKGGNVLIPTFAIGKGQEILFTLENYLRSGTLEPTPIYIDGMVKKALRIYRHNAIYLKKEVQYRILTSDDDPFKSEHYRVPETKSREDVLAQKRAIILATSGMLNGGPVLTYLKKMAGDSRNKIILVGYQAKGTRGREILDGARSLTIDDETIELNLEVDQAAFSGHADYQQLMDFVKSVRGLKNVFIVHGEAQKSEALAEGIEKYAKKTKQAIKVTVPELKAIGRYVI